MSDDFRDVMPDSKETYDPWRYGPFEITYDSDGTEVWGWYNDDEGNPVKDRD